MDPYAPYVVMSPASKAEDRNELEKLFVHDAEFGDVYPEPGNPGRSLGHVLERVFRVTVNGLYLLFNLAVLTVGGGYLSAQATDPGFLDYVLWIVLPVMVIAWMFHAVIGILGFLGYHEARTRYGMIKRVSKLATTLTVIGIAVLVVIWAVDWMMRRGRSNRK